MVMVLVVIMMVSTARWIYLTQSTPRLPVVTAAPAHFPDLYPFVVSYQLELALEDHGNTQVRKEGEFQLSLV